LPLFFHILPRLSIFAPHLLHQSTIYLNFYHYCHRDFASGKKVRISPENGDVTISQGSHTGDLGFALSTALQFVEPNQPTPPPPQPSLSSVEADRAMTPTLHRSSNSRASGRAARLAQRNVR
jgi:hypothetical protein